MLGLLKAALQQLTLLLHFYTSAFTNLSIGLHCCRLTKKTAKLSPAITPPFPGLIPLSWWSPRKGSAPSESWIEPKKRGGNSFRTPPFGSIQLGNRFKVLGKLEQHLAIVNPKPSASPAQSLTRMSGALRPVASGPRELHQQSSSKADQLQVHRSAPTSITINWLSP